MNNTINRMMIGTSLIGITFSLGLGNAYATDQLCAVVPTCEELGYTDTSCPEGSDPIKCPLDLTKLHCGSSNTSTASCEELGYTDTWCDPTPSSGQILKCPSDPRKMLCIYYDSGCAMGDFVYSDWTCSSSKHPTKTVVAIVLLGGSNPYMLAINDVSSATYGGGEAINACKNYKINGVACSNESIMSTWTDSDGRKSSIRTGNTFASNVIGATLNATAYKTIQNNFVAAGGTKMTGDYWGYSLLTLNDNFSGGYKVSYQDNSLPNAAWDDNRYDRLKLRCGLEEKIIKVTRSRN